MLFLFTQMSQLFSCVSKGLALFTLIFNGISINRETFPAFTGIKMKTQPEFQNGLTGKNNC